MSMESEFLTVSQAASLCRVSRATIWRWIKTGHLRAASTAGGHHRINHEDLLDFIRIKKMDLRIRGGTGNKRILVVDDDPEIVRLFQALLTRSGYEVEIATDGFEAGIKTIRFQPDLVILDLFMPKMDGFEVCQFLKGNEETAKTKIIAISGLDTEENRLRILNCGADFFMAKPLDFETLTNEIERLLKPDKL